MTCPTCGAELERLTVGEPTRPYKVWYCPGCDARIELVPTTTAPDYPRSSSDRADSEASA